MSDIPAIDLSGANPTIDLSGAKPAIDLSGAKPAIDLSGAKPTTDMSGVPIVAEVPSPDPAPAPIPPVQTQVAAPAEPPVVVVPALTKELTDAIDGIVHDLSGAAVSVGELIRFVPRLASLVHTLQIRGGEKRDLVMAAGHVLVDRVIGDSERPAAHALVDVVFPPAIACVIDVVAGRVTFQQAAVHAATTAVASAATNQVIVAQAGNCLTQLLACLGKK